MKLAEALILRADGQKRIEQLKQRLIRNAKVQAGDQPAEEPEKLLEELERVAGDVLSLIRRINRTNAATELTQGQTLADAIAGRDVLRLRASIHRDLAQAATITQDRYSKSEVKFVSTMDVRRMQKRADDLAKEIRLLDTSIQETNWRVDLME